MVDDRQVRARETIVQVVTELLESEGYDAVQVRTVARRARVSLSTIYKFFPTRDDLIVTALGRWMEENGYSRLADPPPDMTLYEGLTWVFRQIFEPWERNPHMLRAYHRARTGPGGHRLDLQGSAAVEPVSLAMLADLDPAYAEDVGRILTYLAHAVIGQFAAGELAVEEILPVLDRAVFRLTTNNEPLAAAARPTGRRTARQRQGSDAR
jgi:TetR/AcrR family transcriptional regulator, cholesterol catabolism regulator